MPGTTSSARVLNEHFDFSPGFQVVVSQQVQALATTLNQDILMKKFIAATCLAGAIALPGLAQAREVIDLSMLAQKQIIEDMQQFSTPRALAGAEAA